MGFYNILMATFNSLRNYLPDYQGSLKILEGESYLKALPAETLKRFLSYIGHKADKQKFRIFRWPENLDIKTVALVFDAPSWQDSEFFKIMSSSGFLPGNHVVVGGGHGTGWLGEFQKRAHYTLVQGPDDDGFGALIYPLGVTVPAGDIINSFLAVAQVSSNDRELLNIFNHLNLGRVHNFHSQKMDTIEDYKLCCARFWLNCCANPSRRVERALGRCFENRNLAAFLDYFTHFFLRSPIIYQIPPDFHDVREGFMYGLFLYFSSYAHRLARIRRDSGYPLSHANPQEQRLISRAISEKRAIDRAINEVKQVFNIRPDCHHLVASYQNRSLCGFYSDGRGPFVGVQNCPRGSDTGEVYPESLFIGQCADSGSDSDYPPLDPEVRDAVLSCETLIRSCGSLSTTSGQIFRTPGFSAAVKQNPGSLKVFIFNNAPEGAEGECLRALATLKRASGYFRMPMADFAQVALLPDPSLLTEHPHELRIEQRPGESVAVRLLRDEGTDLLESGVLPLLIDELHSVRRPDLHPVKRLSSILFEVIKFRKWEMDRGLDFTYNVPYGLSAGSLVKPPPLFSIAGKYETWAIADRFARLLFEREKFNPAQFSVNRQQYLINSFRDLACIERFHPPDSLARKINSIVIVPLAGRRQLTVSLELIKEKIPEDAFILSEFRFIDSLRKLTLQDSSIHEEIVTREAALRERFSFYWNVALPFRDQLVDTYAVCAEYLPQGSLSRPESQSLIAIDGDGVLYVSSALFQNKIPLVLSAMMLASFHTLWAFLTRTSANGEFSQLPLLRSLQDDSPFFRNLSIDSLDTLIFSFLLPRGRDLFHIPKNELDILKNRISQLNKDYSQRLCRCHRYLY